MVKFAPEFFGMYPYPINGWTVNVMMYKCWKTIGTIMSPCPGTTSDDCCKTLYHVSPDGTGNYTLSDKARTTPTLPSCSIPCEYDCGANDLPYGPIWHSSDASTCTSVDPCPTIPWNDMPHYWVENPYYTIWIPYPQPPTLLCGPGCLESFTTHVYHYFNINETDYTYVSYKKCTSGEKYIRIEKIDCSYFLSIDPNYTIADLLYHAIRNTLYMANGYFEDHLDPWGNAGPFNYHILLPTCWQRIGTWIVPCDQTTCCEHVYSVGYDQSYIGPYPHGKIITNSTGLNPPYTCPTGCWYMCNVLSNPDFLLLPNLNKISCDNLESSDNTMSPVLLVKPNPADDNIDISLNALSMGNTEFIISNSQGEIFDRQKMDKNSNNLKITIKTEKYPVGSYFINVLINGEKITSDKFIIIR